MITLTDVKIAYHKETGKIWRNELNKKQFDWVIDKLLTHENNILNIKKLFENE